MATENGMIGDGLTFDDILLVPAHSSLMPAEVDLSTHLTPNIKLNIPVVSAAMDTVTEGRLAIALAREGGIGIIHRNLGIERQAEEVDRVKRSESGMIVDPITLSSNDLLSTANDIMSRYHISGIPITEGQKLVGILTNRDIRFVTDFDQPIHQFMTSDNLITAPIGTTLDEAKEILQAHRIEKLPLVDEGFSLKGLITVKDIQKRVDFPQAAKDNLDRLLVGAAVGVGKDLDARLDALLKAQVDVIVLDSSHGHSQRVIDTVRYIRQRHPHVELVAGNVATAEGTEALIEAGASAVKVGVGPGSICTTRVVAGIGVPQVTAIRDCYATAGKYDIPIIADGGVRYSGDIVKALACGASTVMFGNLLAGVEESPGELVLYSGKRFKEYRGMGSMGAMGGTSRDRYFQDELPDIAKVVPEGVEGRVPYRGNLSDVVFQMIGGLRQGMGYLGSPTIDSLTSARFIRITAAGVAESHPHDVLVTKEAPNYRVRDEL
jgi:IMP dehydrogenase